MLETILEAVQEFPATDQVTDQVARLLTEFRGGSKAVTELMEALGLSHRPTFRKNYWQMCFDEVLREWARRHERETE